MSYRLDVETGGLRQTAHQVRASSAEIASARDSTHSTLAGLAPECGDAQADVMAAWASCRTVLEQLGDGYADLAAAMGDIATTFEHADEQLAARARGEGNEE